MFAVFVHDVYDILVTLGRGILVNLFRLIEVFFNSLML